MIKALKKLKNNFEDKPVKNKLMAIILTVSIISTIIVVSAFSVYGIVNIRNEMKSELTVTGTIISNRINAALYFKNNTVAIETLNSLSANSSVQVACVYDITGNVFARFLSGRSTEAKCPDKIIQDKIFFTENNLQLYRTVNDGYDDSVIGYLYIQSDLQRITGFIIRQALISLGIIIAVMVISYLLATKLQRIISQPLSYLIDKNSEVGNLLVQSGANYNSGNEIAQLESLLGAVVHTVHYLKKEQAEMSEKFNDLSKSSEATFNYLSNELKQPLEATMAFGDIISSGAIGNINKEYVSYFNDVYLTVFYYYGIINDTMKFYKGNVQEIKENKEKGDMMKHVEHSLQELSQEKPEFLKDIDFKYSIVSRTDDNAMLFSKSMVQEIVNSTIFVFSKYISLLEMKELCIQVKSKVNDNDKDAPKYELEFSCKELENENIAHILEKHREYQNDVHLLRSKLQYLKYLASYSGGCLDFGDDIRSLSNILIMFPIVENNKMEANLGQFPVNMIKNTVS